MPLLIRLTAKHVIASLISPSYGDSFSLYRPPLWTLFGTMAGKKKTRKGMSFGVEVTLCLRVRF